MIAMVETQLTKDAVPDWLIVSFCVSTTILIAVHLFALLVSICILPNLEVKWGQVIIHYNHIFKKPTNKSRGQMGSSCITLQSTTKSRVQMEWNHRLFSLFLHFALIFCSILTIFTIFLPFEILLLWLFSLCLIEIQFAMIQPKLVKFRPFFFEGKTNVRELYLPLMNNHCYRLNFNFNFRNQGLR